MASLHFLGAAGTVTGSKFLLEHDGKQVLVDCGLFQGQKELRQRNWEPLPLPAREIDAIVLTHAHIDHTGGLPRVVREGYDGPIYTTPGTRDLTALLLPDSAHLHEEEARYANKEGYSKHRPALPLYTVPDAERAVEMMETFGYERPKEILPGITLTFYRAGHILGSAVCVFDLKSTRQRVVFSGDLGRYNAPILRDPQSVDSATTLVVESTYGDRQHRDTKPVDALCEAVTGAFERGGVVVIPAFAVGRTQEILFHLRNLEEAKRIPEVDVFVDSPMACDATPLYLMHPEEHDLVMKSIVERGASPLATRRTRFVTSAKESKQLNQHQGPAVIISASGMATGGRVLHHLKHRLPDPRNTVLFVGYQSVGSRGRRLLDGEKETLIHGQRVPVAAEIHTVSGFSAHADWTETMRWMEGFDSPPRQTLLVHGEPEALEALRRRVQARSWNAYVPGYMEKVELDLSV
ncbi:MBL fold metallo-hydrolase [Myxococcus llanfairpwllgwyngyllgogerychwyrndrobwllllantysiliogogogochensis]|uniref:MBL fold metallo-hydrolase n=1 Tax=Myxococcus llanfairpwllgwyngyllgogerychwyrndrobwllllantysiliogogogochensis TaxID=2590453 RepID=A0A540WSS2_9BACT|nr:MBL fold metallo-hydrolase [Myxococcus llanfairpwllgwyngyllgogerychwyrndrobwllllantysiliogogogochensis]TQF12062.1 MBL fold metallo-hydrolase [Myxococcus llanfairpwllgwyngyllgogerychwyrndrobwllllantysiliogogogochensis]